MKISGIKMNKYIDMEEYAVKYNIPIMQKEGIDFLINTLNELKMKSCLEIGSAIGYSSIVMVTSIKDFTVTTIELNEERYNEALKNIDKYNCQNLIDIYHDDALEFDVNKINKQFDCLFIDAAKAQYRKFFEKYMPLIKEDGICIVDNLDFHGMIHDIDHIKNRNTKQLVKKIKRFRDWIFDNDEYEVTYYEIGDGICIIKRR